MAHAKHPAFGPGANPGRAPPLGPWRVREGRGVAGQNRHDGSLPELRRANIFRVKLRVVQYFTSTSITVDPSTASNLASSKLGGARKMVGLFETPKPSSGRPIQVLSNLALPFSS